MNWRVHALPNGRFSIRFEDGDGTEYLPAIETVPSHVMALVSDKRTVLLDTGFSTGYIPGPGSSGDQPEEEQIHVALSKAGIAPESVTDILLTHLHWDHTGGMKAFPGVRYHIQKDELRSLAHLKPNEETYYHPAHFMPHLDQMVLHDGDVALFDGLTLIRTARHTPGHQSVLVETEAGTLALAGDLPFDYSLLWTALPPKLWTRYRNSPAGRKAWWPDASRTRLMDWLERKGLTAPPNPEPGPDAAALRKRSARVILTHDPSLGAPTRLRPKARTA